MSSNTNTDIALLQKDVSYIKEWMEEMKEQHKEIKAILQTFPERFASKWDHESNSKRIAELEDDKKAIIKWIVIAFIAIISSLIWLAKYIW